MQNEDQEKTLVERLAEFAAGLTFEQLPDSVVRRANDCFFDLVGCYYGALKKEENRKIAAELAKLNPAKEAVIWGTKHRCGIAGAALALGTLGYDLEYDDGISVSGHWGSASIPAAYLAVREMDGDGRDLVTAITAAYEVGSRISRVFSPELLKRHIHFPCTMGAFGAAAGYGAGRGKNADVLAGALSLAGLFPVGAYSTATSGAPGKGLYSGWPGYLGIHAVRLAGMGLTGDRDIMEHPDGFGRAVGLGPADPKVVGKALEGLGEQFHIMETYFKPYPCCRWLHAPVMGILELMREQRLRREDIERVIIGSPEFALMYDTREGFHTSVKCQYSIPYSVGAAAWFGRLTPEEYGDEARENEEFLRFIGRIDMVYDEELQKKFPGEFAVKMQVFTRDGQTYARRQSMPWGPENPPSAEELEDKFSMLTKDILTEEEICQWIEIHQRGIDKEGMFAMAAGLLERNRT